jgi:hypothetical protein
MASRCVTPSLVGDTEEAPPIVPPRCLLCEGIRMVIFYEGGLVNRVHAVRGQRSEGLEVLGVKIQNIGINRGLGDVGF